MQFSKIYFPHIFPLLCLITGLVLVTLCIVAGNAPGFMEEYALIRVSPILIPFPLLAKSLDGVLTRLR